MSLNGFLHYGIWDSLNSMDMCIVKKPFQLLLGETTRKYSWYCMCHRQVFLLFSWYVMMLFSLWLIIQRYLFRFLVNLFNAYNVLICAGTKVFWFVKTDASSKYCCIMLSHCFSSEVYRPLATSGGKEMIDFNNFSNVSMNFICALFWYLTAGVNYIS